MKAQRLRWRGTAPGGELVQPGAGEGQHVAVGVAQAGRSGQCGAGAEVAIHLVEILLRGLPRRAAGEQKVADDGVEHQAGHVAAEQAVGGEHRAQAEAAAALGQARPVLCIVARTQSSPHQGRRAPQHAGDQLGVRGGDAQVVGEHRKVRDAVLRVGHVRGHVDDRQAEPGKAHEDFDIESHAPRNVRAEDAHRGGQRVEPEAAHRVGHLARQGFDTHPEVGDGAAVQARLGYAVVVDWPAADHRLGLGRAEFEKARHVGQVVLAVGVNLQRMGQAVGVGLLEAGDHRRAFAAIDGQGDEACLRAVGHRLRQGGAGGRIAAVVDQIDRQIVACQR